jgi:hypothetical protein
MSRRWLRITALWLLPAGLALLTIGDGILHLRLNYLLNGGTLWGKISMKGSARPPGPPPGGPPAGMRPLGGRPPSNPFPLPLNEMFTLNFIAALVLTTALLVAIVWLPRWLALVDVALMAFSAASIYGWWEMGKPNPQGLGHLSKLLELAIIALAAVQVVIASRGSQTKTERRARRGGVAAT